MEVQDLPDLPEELWLRIFSEISPRDDLFPYGAWDAFHDLSALCLVCEKFRRIAQPVLYKRMPCFVLDPRILRTLCARPDLGLAAREISIGSGNSMATVAVYNCFKEVGSSLPLPLDFKARVREGLKSGQPDAQVVFFLAMVPAARQVEIRFEDVDDMILELFELTSLFTTRQNRCRDQETSNTSSLAYPLARMKQLTLWFSNIGNARSWKRLDFLRLPNLQSLTCVRMNWNLLPQLNLENPLGLRHINLDYVFMNTAQLSWLLSICPYLKILRVQWEASHELSLENNRGMDFGAIGDALRQYGTDLESLDLHVDALNHREVGILGSLKELHKLRSLRISSTLVAGSQSRQENNNQLLQMKSLLPDSLESLALYDSRAYDQVVVELPAFLQSKKLPNLSELGMVIPAGNIRGILRKVTAADVTPLMEGSGWAVDVQIRSWLVLRDQNKKTPKRIKLNGMGGYLVEFRGWTDAVV
ncbi:hypothetical protein BX600DRAFT_447635 [Xylariales sp. PMI_506]|nr:hypothetical protein BX600DRAFT_447635 [Xylariales sp. PMI_506]